MDGIDRLSMYNERRIMYECIPCMYQIIGGFKSYLVHKNTKRCWLNRKKKIYNIPKEHFVNLRLCMFEIKQNNLKCQKNIFDFESI
jgi:hypothetical protein